MLTIKTVCTKKTVAGKRFEKKNDNKDGMIYKKVPDDEVPRSLAPIKKDHFRPKTTVYTSTNNHLGWELGGTGVLGVETGDRALIHGDVLQ